MPNNFGGTAVGGVGSAGGNQVTLLPETPCTLLPRWGQRRSFPQAENTSNAFISVVVDQKPERFPRG